MFENALWIGKARGEFAPWKTVKRTDEAEEELARSKPADTSSALYRKSFTLRSGIASARLSVCGLGFYDAFINGIMPDSRRVLTPVPSDYYKKARYDTYDVLALVKPGENALGIHLCGGWFSPPEKWWTSWQMIWYGNPRLIAQLDVEYTDGAVECIVTDTSWLFTAGPVLKSCIYDGEIYDHRLLPVGWALPGFNCSAWKNVSQVEALPDRLEQSYVPPVRVIRELEPVSTVKREDGVLLCDFGENNAVIPKVTVKGRAGDTVTLHFSEFVNSDGTLDRGSEGGAECTDTYTLSGGTDVCMPRFTYHGARYMTITLSSPETEITDIRLCVIHSDIGTTGSFSCSREELNRLHSMYVRTQLACLQGYPVDCPQRNERKGWLGDAHVTAEMCLYNFDMRQLYASFLDDIRLGRLEESGKVQIICPDYQSDSTSVDWNLAYPVILSEYYARYGDKELLRSHYPALLEHTQAYINELEDGFIPPCWFGDWFSVDTEEDTQKVAFRAGHERHRQNPPYAATMFFCQTLRLTAEISDILGFSEDAQTLRGVLAGSRAALINRCYDSEKHIFGSGGQFLLTYALAEELVPEEDREEVFENLIREFEKTGWHTVFGVVGLRRVFDVFDSFRRPDLAYRLFGVKDYPSPLNMLSGGRTTLTEGLDGSGSGCHCMFDSPDAFFFKTLGGIRINRKNDIPVEIRPYCPEDTDSVYCAQTLEEGIVSVDWRRENDRIIFDIAVPDGIRAYASLSNGEKKYTSAASGKLQVIL